MRNDNSSKTGKGAGAMDGETKPEWADGLRRFYDSVLDEPVPDTFKDLLSKLDNKP